MTYYLNEFFKTVIENSYDLFKKPIMVYDIFHILMLIQRSKL